MLGVVRPASYRMHGGHGAFTVALAGTTIEFDDAATCVDRPLEQLANAIEGCVAFERVKAMLAAADAERGPLPLWLVTGSSVLAAWLAWSRSEAAFRRSLTLSDHVNAAPVTGIHDRPTRRALGQTAAKIRVRNGLAVAERIDLAGRLQSTAAFGRKATISIKGGPLPDTLTDTLAEDRLGKDRRRIGDVIDHPFFTSTDLKLAGAHNDGSAVMIDIESRWEPLAEVPQEAWHVLPRDADRTCPWRMTSREIAELYRLVDAKRLHTDSA